MTKIKELIKELSAQQRQLRKERKSKYEGEKLFPSKNKQWWTDWQYAYETHKKNRFELRHLFAAYAIIRGKELPEPKHKVLWEPKVEKLVKKYTEVLEPV